MRGWFDAFRTDGGPTLYAYSNRTSVTGDVPTITICLVFLTIFLAFITIFPGFRKERFASFCTVTLSLLTGTIICVCNYGSCWHVATGEIVSSYRAFSRDKIHAKLGVSIGLDHANVTLNVIPRSARVLDINFNERFQWIEQTDIKEHYRRALVKGLPYPILTVAEYLALDNGGFAWGSYYRIAGYYTSIVLWSAFASWVLMNVLLLNVPRYGAYMMVITGSLMDLSCLVFWFLKPPRPLILHFEDISLTFSYGWCFWLVLVVGTMIASAGIVITIVDLIYPNKFSTALEIDFDTPYDRHIIIEDSCNTRKRRFKIPRLEEPFNVGLTAGSKLLRRLSKRGNKENGKEDHQVNPGVDNLGYEMEAQKTSWKYPSSLVTRTDSKKSTKSVNFRTTSQRSHQFLDIPQLPDHDDKKDQFQRTDSKQSSLSSCSMSSTPKSVNFEDAGPSSVGDMPSMNRQDSNQSCVSSSSSSYGLDMLSRGSSIRKISAEEMSHEQVSRTSSANIIVFHRTDSRGQLQRLSGEVVEIQTDDSTDIW